MYYNAPPSPGLAGPAQQPWTRSHHPVLGPMPQPGGVLPPTPSPGYGMPQYGPPPHHSHHPHHQHHHHGSISQQPWGSPTTQHTMPGAHVGAGVGAVGMGGVGAGQMRPQSPGELTPNWQQQLKVAHACRLASAPHHRARQSAFTARAQTKSVIAITDPNAPRPSSSISIPHSSTPNPYPGPSSTPAPPPSLTNGHHHHAHASSISSLASVDPKFNHPSGTVGPVAGHAPVGEGPPALSAKAAEQNPWTVLDMGGMHLKSLSPRLYTFTYLRTLYMNHNRLTSLPPAIGALKQLTHLDLTANNLLALPPEIGLLSSLKELLLFDNSLSSLPHEIGTLHQLELIGIEGNPLPAEVRQIIQKDGTAALVAFLRDAAPVPPPPPERPWRDLPLPAEAVDGEPFTLVNYNILCERAATTALYGYTPTWALAWEFRRQLVMAEITSYGADFVCLQEVDVQNYEEFFQGAMDQLGYDSVYWPKSRSRTMHREEGRRVDGCATFFKRERYQLIEKQLIDFSQIAVQRPDFKKTDELFSRVLARDHIAVVCLLENRRSGTRLVLANLHIHWDPQFSDVKLVQTAVLMDELDKIAARFATLPPRLNVVPEAVPIPPSPSASPSAQSLSVSAVSPSPSPAPEPAPEPPTPAFPAIMKGTPMGPAYADGTKIPTIVCGDFNSIPSSGVYDFLSTGRVGADHPDFLGHDYGQFMSRGLTHRLKLRSAYADVAQMGMTNFTPSFEGVIDYIWYTTDSLAVRSVLAEVDPAYLAKTVGFPNAHFPSDHICLAGEFRLKSQPAAAPKSTRAPVFPNGRPRANNANSNANAVSSTTAAATTSPS